MQGRLTFLGTGASVGVPLIGCECSVCRSDSPFNKRLRPSALINVKGKQFLIDAGPDFRTQALRSNIKVLDGIIFTHAHYDHTAGIDELRVISYNMKKPVPVLLSKETADDIRIRFYYIFPNATTPKEFVNRLKLQLLLGEEGQTVFEGVPIGYFSYEQGGMKVNGFRFGTLAYLSDIRIYSPTIFDHLKGIKTLVISALRYETNALHFSVQEAVDFIEKVGAEKAWLMHISHDLDHESANAALPQHIRLAYDGLEIEFG